MTCQSFNLSVFNDNLHLALVHKESFKHFKSVCWLYQNRREFLKKLVSWKTFKWTLFVAMMVFYVLLIFDTGLRYLFNFCRNISVFVFAFFPFVSTGRCKSGSRGKNVCSKNWNNAKNKSLICQYYLQNNV